MTIKKLVLFVCVLVGFIIVLSFIAFSICYRLDILSDYKQLLSDPDAVKRLESEPVIKQWTSYPADNPVSIGYASFDFPFGEIYEITEEFRGVTIDSDEAKLRFVFSMRKDFDVDIKQPENYLPGLVYKGGEIKARDNKYQKYDIMLWKLEAEMPKYEFDRIVFELKPKPIKSLRFMDFDELFLYERMMEIKNAQLWGGDVYLFETENLRGKVEREDWIEKEENYANCYMVLMRDVDNTVIQLVQIISYVDEITFEEIEQFLSSFAYDMNAINSNSEDIRPVILEALQRSEYYTPSVQIE